MPQPQQQSEVLDRADRARQVIDEYLRRCGDGDALDQKQILTDHAELMPELERELQKLQLIGAARVQAESVGATSNNALPAGPPPDSFPGYEVIRKIQRGGQGVVYQAVEKGSTRKVAIKVIRGGPFAGPHDRARFQREVRILNALRHPHIVTVRDSGMASGHFYFVMDYIAGQPLDVHMSGAQRSIKETLTLFQKICGAVNAAHLRGVIHRDLKPSNIRLDEHGEPFVLDFGLAKFGAGAASEKTDGKMTVTGEFVGSLPWASPEQVDGSPERIDVRTDVYALGVVLFQMLTGRFPYGVVGKMRAVMDNILHAEPDKPSSLRRAVNDEVETIVLKCLNKEPERRYQSAGELARDIERYLNGEPIEAKRDSTWYLLKKTVRRHWLPTAVAATFLVLVIGFGVTVSVMYRRAANEAATAHRVQALLESLFSELEPTENASQLTVRDILDQGAERVARQLADEPAAQVGLMETIANRYTALGLHKSAVAWLERAMSIRRTALHDDIEVTAERLTALGSAYWASGSEAKARAALDEAIVLHRQLPGSGSANMASTFILLARGLQFQGAVEDAERLFREALETCRRLHAEPHQDTVEALLWFGSFAGNVGRKQQAKELLEEALAMARRVHTSDHPQLALVLGNFGGQLQDMADYDAALPLALERHAMVRRFYRGDSASVAESLLSLGLLRKDMGDYGAAESLVRQGLEMNLRLTGGHENKTIAASYNSLAKVYSDAAEWTKAQTACRQSLDIYLKLLPRDHLLIARPLTHLGRILVHLDRHAEAEPLLQEALATRRKRRPETHWKTAKTASVLGACLTGLGRFKEAEPLLIDSYPLIARDRGANHRRTIEALTRIIDLYEAWGRPDKVADYRARLPDGERSPSRSAAGGGI